MELGSPDGGSLLKDLSCRDKNSRASQPLSSQREVKATMLQARNASWVALFEIFQEIHPKKLIPEKDWQALSTLIEALRDGNHREDWAEIFCAFDAIDGSHKVATSEEWRKLYDALDKLWQDERINNVTTQELEAHSGAFTRFRLFN
jgi:hypothetical protein